MSQEISKPVGSPASTTPRALKQLGLFFAGSAFLLASVAVSRRAVTRKNLAAFPKFYQPNVRAPARGETALRGGVEPGGEGGGGAVMAAEALGLATLNVVSFGIMMAGGAAFALDVSNLEELRWYARVRMYGPAGKVDEEAEKVAEREMEEWVTKILSKSGVKLDEKEMKELKEGKPREAE